MGCDALVRIGTLSRHLTGAEFKTVYELAARDLGSGEISASQAELARTSGLSRRSVQIALEALKHRGLILSAGVVKKHQPLRYRLLFCSPTVPLEPAGPSAESSTDGQPVLRAAAAGTGGCS